MPKSTPLKSLRSDIDDALDLLETLIENARTIDERNELLDINSALIDIATQIDNQELSSRNAAIAALAKELGASAKDLDAIHQRAVDLKNTLDIAQKLLDAFGNIVSAVNTQKPAPKKPAGTGKS